MIRPNMVGTYNIWDQNKHYVDAEDSWSDSEPYHYVSALGPFRVRPSFIKTVLISRSP